MGFEPMTPALRGATEAAKKAPLTSVFAKLAGKSGQPALAVYGRARARSAGPPAVRNVASQRHRRDRTYAAGDRAQRGHDRGE